ncbi:MAG: methylthioribulose 1-phosphate dehydratase [Terriglobia bacterium]
MRSHTTARRGTRIPAEPGQRKTFRQLAASLAAIGREFHFRGWALGTSGNFSAVIRRDPLRLAITPTGVDKSTLAAAAILQVEAGGRARNGLGQLFQSPSGASAQSSAETLLHLTVAQARSAGAVLHTHSIWSTVLSSQHAAQGGIAIEGYEMLKGLAGVRTHEHREWLPILENSQDMAALAESVQQALKKYPAAHGFLLRGHGLYTWGRDLAEAKRHVEILEFLLEVSGRRFAAGAAGAESSVDSVLSVPAVLAEFSACKTGRAGSRRRSGRRKHGTGSHPGRKSDS